MEEKNFKIIEKENDYVLSKNGQTIKIWQSSDNDIWFETKQEQAEIELDSCSENFCEFQLFATFERLMKSIIGRYMLKDAKNPYSSLPEDFINLENMAIVWHSDGSTNSTLEITYNGKTIKVVVTKDNKTKTSVSNRVRVRTNGSDYGTYYQEFIRFFDDIKALYYIINIAKEKQVIPQDTTPTPPPRKLSLKRFLPQKKQ